MSMFRWLFGWDWKVDEWAEYVLWAKREAKKKNKIGIDEEMKKRVEKCLKDLRGIEKKLKRGGLVWLRR